MSKPLMVRVDPGKLIYYTLDALTRPVKDVGLDKWGICECQNLLWLGKDVPIEGKNALRVSLLDILDKRDDGHSDWGDEEIYVFAGFDRSGHFSWFLLSKEEYKREKEMAQSMTLS